jgi:hypothetical protein
MVIVENVGTVRQYMSRPLPYVIIPRISFIYQSLLELDRTTIQGEKRPNLYPEDTCFQLQTQYMTSLPTWYFTS